MVFSVEDHRMKPARVLGICCGAYPARLLPNVAKLPGCRIGLLFNNISNGVPNAGCVKHPPYRSGKEGQEMEVSAHILKHRLGYLVLEPECYHSSGSFADVHDCGRPIPTTCVLGAGLPEEVNLLTYV